MTTTETERAKKVKYDEFYTRYEDIEKEISMYDKKIWKNKVWAGYNEVDWFLTRLKENLPVLPD